MESVSPDHMTLVIERKVSRVINVSARLEGKPAPGYRTTDVDLSPDHVTVEGRIGKAITFWLRRTDGDSEWLEERFSVDDAEQKDDRSLTLDRLEFDQLPICEVLFVSIPFATIATTRVS